MTQLEESCLTSHSSQESQRRRALEVCWEDREHVSRNSIGLLGKDRVLRGTDTSASLGAPDYSLECTGDMIFMLPGPMEAASILGGDLQIPYGGLNQIFPPKVSNI